MPKFRMPLSRTTLLGSLLLLLNSTVVDASGENPNYYPQSEWNTYSLGMGGATKTFADDASAILNNPAGLAYHRNSGTFEATGGVFSRGDSNQMSYSLIDGKTSTIVGGLQFQKFSSETSDRYSYAASAAYPMGNFYFGVTSRYITMKGGESGSRNVWSNNFGVLSLLGQNAALSLTLNNVDTDSSRFTPMSLGMGLGLQVHKVIRLGIESDRPLASPSGVKEDFNLSFGTQVLMKEVVALRGGYRWDRMGNTSAWSTGIGLEAQKIRLGFSYVGELDTDNQAFHFMGTLLF